MHWRVADTSVQEIRFSDVWPTCQWEKKRIIDVSGTRQATKKNIKCRPLTCQPHVKTQNKSDSVVEAFYCWRVMDTSVVSKIEQIPAKNWNFIDWRVNYTSTLKGFFAFGMRWRVATRQLKQLASVTCQAHVSTRQKLKAQEIRFSDVWPTCQWEKKRIIDVSGTRQATKKNIKCRPLTCQPHVKTQNKSDSVVEAFYCWRVMDTSVVSKIEQIPAKNWNFIDWRVNYTSTLKGFFAFGMRWRVATRQLKQLASVTCQAHVSTRQKLKA